VKIDGYIECMMKMKTIGISTTFQDIPEMVISGEITVDINHLSPREIMNFRSPREIMNFRSLRNLWIYQSFIEIKPEVRGSNRLKNHCDLLLECSFVSVFVILKIFETPR
jgi:hypothetical protein